MERVKTCLKKNKYAALSFFTTFFILCLIAVLKNVFPFGDRGLMEMDFYHQYFPFFSEFLHKIKNGESLFYSWNLGLGTDFLPLFSYYLASPLNWLIILFPEKYLLEALTLLTFIKMSLCSVSFFVYIRFHFKKDSLSVVCFSLFYSMSGFLAAYSWNIMWLDNIILAPLIIMGLEKLFYQKKYFSYTVFLSLSILSDFYLSIMICIFVVLWFLMLLILNPEKYRRIFPFAGCSLLAGAISSVLLLPTLCFMQWSSLGHNSFPDSFKFYFSVLDMLSRHFINVKPELMLEHYPNIYCGVFILLLIPLYFMNRKILWKEKTVKLLFIVFLLFSFSNNVLTFVWHGFAYPNSLPSRESFLYIFLILVMSFESFMKLKEESPVKLLLAFLLNCVFMAVCIAKIGVNSYFSESSYWDTALFLIMYGLLFSGICLLDRKKISSKWIKIFPLLFFAFTVLESGINLSNTGFGTYSRSKYFENIEDYRNLVQHIPQTEKNLYRFEKRIRNTKNDGALVGYSSASMFSSMINPKIEKWYERTGLHTSHSVYTYDGATPLTSALLNVKYLFVNRGIKLKGPLFKLVAETGNVGLYEISSVLPVGFTVPEGFRMPDETMKGMSPIEVQNAMVENMDAGGPLFSQVNVSDMENPEVNMFKEPGYYYGIQVPDEEKQSGKKHKDRHNEIVFLGYQEAGDVYHYKPEEDGEDLKLITYKLNMGVLQNILKQFKKSELEVSLKDSTGLSGTADVSEAGQFAMMIPYDPGWKLKVDGIQQNIESFGDAFLCVEMEKGHHTFSFSYVPEGFVPGLIISLLSVLMLTVLSVIHYSRSGRHVARKENES